MHKVPHTFTLLSLIAIGPATAQTPVPHLAYSPSIRIAVDPQVNGWQMETAVAGNALDRVLAVTIADTQRTWDEKSSAVGLLRQAGFERVQEVDLNLPQLSFPSSVGAMLVKDAFDPFACADLAGNLWVGAAAWSGPRGEFPHTSGVFVRRAPANGQLAPTTQWIYAKRWPDPAEEYQSSPVEIGDRPTTADQRGETFWLEYYGLAAVGQKVYATFSQHDPNAPGPRTIRAFLRRIDVGINEN